MISLMVHGIQEYWAWPFTSTFVFIFLICWIKYEIYGCHPLDDAWGLRVLGLAIYLYTSIFLLLISLIKYQIYGLCPGSRSIGPGQQNICEQYRNRLLHIICQCWKNAWYVDLWKIFSFKLPAHPLLKRTVRHQSVWVAKALKRYSWDKEYTQFYLGTMKPCVTSLTEDEACKKMCDFVQTASKSFIQNLCLKKTILIQYIKTHTNKTNMCFFFFIHVSEYTSISKSWYWYLFHYLPWGESQ